MTIYKFQGSKEMKFVRHDMDNVHMATLHAVQLHYSATLFGHLAQKARKSSWYLLFARGRNILAVNVTAHVHFSAPNTPRYNTTESNTFPTPHLHHPKLTIKLRR